MPDTKVFAIVGPTASGKSSLAVQLAKLLNGEIISADSMQVYQGMDIGTAKVTEEEMQGIPHHLIDIYPIDKPWNVRTFQTLCRQKIDEIVGRGHVPILCGGTGLYVKAALYDYQFDEENEEQNSKLTEALQSRTNEELYALLQEKDPGALEKIHINNRKRLLRAAAMALSDRPKSEREKEQTHQPVYDVYFIGLRGDRKQEIERINRRVDEMFEQGLPEEVKRLFSDPSSRSWNSFQGIGYKEFSGWLDGNEDLDTVREQIKIHTRQYARRQMTWFVNQMPVHWFDPSDRAQIISAAEDWYGKNE